MNSSLFTRDIIARGLTHENKKLLQETGAIDFNNTQYTYDVDNNLTDIVFKDSNNITIRTDSFTYSSDATTETITHVIAVVGGKTTTLVTVFDLEGNVQSVTRTVV